jgi:hypothetical protein
MAPVLRMVSLVATLVAQTVIAAAAPRSICYKVTAQAWDADAGRSLPTSPALLERIHRAFGLWQEASRGALEFRFAGLAAPAYDGVAQVPYDGCLYAVLDGDFNFHGELGQGGFNGTIPGEHKRGYFFLNRDPDATRSGTIILRGPLLRTGEQRTQGQCRRPATVARAKAVQDDQTRRTLPKSAS